MEGFVRPAADDGQRTVSRGSALLESSSLGVRVSGACLESFTVHSRALLEEVSAGVGNEHSHSMESVAPSSAVAGSDRRTRSTGCRGSTQKTLATNTPNRYNNMSTGVRSRERYKDAIGY